MKVFYFWEKDSIYDIFQIIEKCPSKYKKILFNIDEKNEFFDNKWWIKLVIEKAKEKQLEIVFEISNQKQESLMKNLWVEYIWKKEPLYKKIKKSFVDFLELFKSKHSFYYKHYNIIKIILLWFEIFLLFFVVYFLYNLITPKSDVYIQASVNIKHLINKIYIYPFEQKNNYNIWEKENLPYKKDTFEKVYTLKIPVKDIKYIAKPSYWTVIFYNTTIEWLSLKANTLLKTEDWLLFRLVNWVYIPPKDANWKIWTAKVKVRAETTDENGLIMWEKWNLLEWTELFVSKLYLSYWKKKIYAKVYKDFSWWETNSKWEVTIDDVNLLKKELLEQFKKNYKKNIYKYLQIGWNTKIPLLYKNLYGYKNIKYNIYSNPWDKTAYIKWDIIWDIYFNYIEKKDLKKLFDNYLKDRLVSKNDFLWYDENSIEIKNIDNISKWLYMITISINVLLWYDFDEDYNDIKSKIVASIKSKTVEEAKNIILSYPEISGVEIKTNDRLHKISNLNSRIYVHIVK